MKKLAYLFILGLLVGCTGTPTGNITWGSDTITRHEDSNKVVMTFPLALDKSAVADSINNTIHRTLVENFGTDSPNDLKECNVRTAIDTLFAQKLRDSVLQKVPYLLLSEGSVYERGGVSSVYLQQYIFQGGAHGLSPSHYLNFNQQTGSLLGLTDLCKDTAQLTRLNREAFAGFMKSKGTEDYASYLFVTADQLPLPQNIGFDSEGVVMLYNQYEIAAYAFGQSRYVIPYSTVESILAPVVREKR